MSNGRGPDPLIALLGYRSVRDHSHSLDYGVTDAVFSVETPVNGEPASCGSGFHVCFVAPDRDAVQASHRMALELGGRD